VRARGVGNNAVTAGGRAGGGEEPVISGAEIGSWFFGVLFGIMSLSLLATAVTPGYGAHFGGLGELGILTGVLALVLIAVGLKLTIRRRRRDSA